MEYYINSFVNGESINNIHFPLISELYKKIAYDVYNIWFELTKIKTLKYSEKGKFFIEDAATIFKKKLEDRLRHPVFNKISKIELEKTYSKCCDIIVNCDFSKPSLIHMDIKPANIVYDSESKLVTLIDFEHARFGDIDFGWTQILLSGINSFGKVYEELIYPHIIENGISLPEALKIPKFKCYIFYQTACNLIYYYENNAPCPINMEKCFYYLLDELAKE